MNSKSVGVCVGLSAVTFILFAPESASAQACEQERRRPSLFGEFVGALAGAAGSTIANQMSNWGVRPSYRFRSTLNRALTDGIACLLNPAEREQAAAATDQAIALGVGSQVTWQSETRPGVSGTTTVTASIVEASGGSCVDMTEVLVGAGGQDAVVRKRMCRRPGESGYQIVQAA